MTRDEANEFMQGDKWGETPCGGCGVLLERGGGARPSGKRDADGKQGTDVHMLCHDCIYSHDRAEFLSDGLLIGSTLPSGAFCRRDLEVYRPFFEAEVMMTPTMQAAWEKYKEHPTLNDKHTKRAILVDTSAGTIYSRDWGDDFAKMCADKVAPGAVVIEIFDGMCGYVGIEIYKFGREDGMWAQGQVREKGAEAWYRSCYGTLVYLREINSAAQNFLDPDAIWRIRSVGIRGHLAQSYGWPALCAA